MREPIRAGDRISFTVYGDPAPQGSKNGIAVARKGPNGEKVYTGQVVMLESSKETLDPWRAAVEKAAREAFRGSDLQPFLGAVSLGLGVCLKRGKTVTRDLPSVRPDLSKLVRAVEDGITDGGLWGDDALVVGYHWMEKAYAGGNWLDGSLALDRPGALITIVALEDNPVRTARKPPKARVPAPAQERPGASRSARTGSGRLRGPVTPVEPSQALLDALRDADGSSEDSLWT